MGHFAYLVSFVCGRKGFETPSKLLCATRCAACRAGTACPDTFQTLKTQVLLRCRGADPRCRTRGCTRRREAPRRHLLSGLRRYYINPLRLRTPPQARHPRQVDRKAGAKEEKLRWRLRASRMAHSLHKESGNLRHVVFKDPAPNCAASIGVIHISLLPGV